MHDSVERVQRQIAERGGELTANALAELFRQMDQRLGADFDPGRFVKDALRRLFDGDWRTGPMSRSQFDGDEFGLTSNGAFNVIPSPPGRGGCAKLCITFVDAIGNRSRMPSSSGSLTLAMLLQSRYWFSCLMINEENLILVSSFSQELFDLRVKDLIESYTLGHSKKVFIVEITKSGPFLRWPY